MGIGVVLILMCWLTAIMGVMFGWSIFGMAGRIFVIEYVSGVTLIIIGGIIEVIKVLK